MHLGEKIAPLPRFSSLKSESDALAAEGKNNASWSCCCCGRLVAVIVVAIVLVIVVVVVLLLKSFVDNEPAEATANAKVFFQVFS